MNAPGRLGLSMLFVAVAWGGALHAAPPAARAAPSEPPVLDPAAMALLDRMAAYLRALPAFALHADATKEEIVHGDFKVQRAHQIDVTMSGPARLRAVANGGDGARTFVYDGASVTVYTQPEGYLATAAAPRTTREMLDAMLDRYGVELPLLDVLYVAAGGDVATDLVEAGDIGPSAVGGVPCEQLAFRGPKADWQIWIERGERPLPHKVVVTTRDEPLAPEFTALLLWDTAPSIDDATFRIAPPAGAKPIPFKPLAAAPADRK